VTKIFEGYGSGLSVAVSRSDMDLARTCFERIMTERSAPTIAHDLVEIALEQCFYLIGDIIPIVREQYPSKERLWRGVQYMVAAPTNKDAAALLRLATAGDAELEDKEFLMAKRLCSKSLVKAVRMLEVSVNQLQLDEQQKEVATFLIAEASKPGLATYRALCLLALYLFIARGITRKKVHKAIKANGPLKKGKTRPLPWWAFSPEATVGKLAIKAFIATYGGIDEKTLARLWYLYEVEACPKVSDMADIPKCVQTVWWPRYLEMIGGYQGKSKEHTHSLWIGEIRQKVGRMVERIISED
jgi:hypothetical protein